MKQGRPGASARPAHRWAGHWAGHTLTATVVVLGVVSVLAGVRLQAPVPLDGDRQGAVWLCVLALAAAVALCAWRSVKAERQRAVAALVTVFVLPVMGATSIPDLLNAANAGLLWPRVLSEGEFRVQASRIETLVSLQTQALGKHRQAHLLVTRLSPDTADTADTADMQRHISRHQLAALQELQRAGTLRPGMQVRVTIEQGQLGWNFVRSIAPMPQ